MSENCELHAPLEKRVDGLDTKFEKILETLIDLKVHLATYDGGLSVIRVLLIISVPASIGAMLASIKPV